MTKKPTGVKVTPLSIKKIRSIALKVRRLLDVPEGAVNIVDILEFQLAEMGLEYEFCSKQEMSDDHGLTIPSMNKIKIRNDVYEGADIDNGRDRFTLAHELGHLVLHADISFARTQVETDHQVFEDSEWQANTFAAEFMMPLDEIQKYCKTPGDIVKRFTVTEKAAQVRFNKLKEKGEI